jgi:hypothetical protein
MNVTNGIVGTVLPGWGGPVPQEPQFANMQVIVMKKEELINTLVENKAKHDVLLEAAIAGYWKLAQEKIDEKRKQLKTSVGEFVEDVETQLRRTESKINKKEVLPSSLSYDALNFSSHLNLVHPTSHGSDYERAIRMMKASIYDEVKLTEHEFDQYVLNNWSWKAQFVASNSSYVSKGSAFINSTGCYFGETIQYNGLRNTYASGIMCSGAIVNF